jgi:hypothetical protein
MTDANILESFAGRLDALGPDLSRWPETLAEEARALVARSPEARALHRDARRLADLVTRAAVAETPNGFAFRVVGEVASRRSDRLSWLMSSPRRFGLAGASFCAAALAIGVALGAAAGPAQAGGSLDLGAAFEVSFMDGDL